MITDESIKKVIQFFEKLSDVRATNQSPYLGICEYYCKKFNGYNYLRLQEIKLIWEEWEHHSGDSLYPIPATSEDLTSPHDQFMSTANLWEGEQGELRKQLCKFTAEKLKERYFG